MHRNDYHVFGARAGRPRRCAGPNAPVRCPMPPGAEHWASPVGECQRSGFQQSHKVKAILIYIYIL